MLVTIPILENSPFIDQVTNLDGTDYELRLRYNQREERWFLSIGLPDGTEIAKGAALVVGWRLFPNVVHELMPPGVLFVTSADGTDLPPKFAELGPGKRCELVYLDAAGLAEAGG